MKTISQRLTEILDKVQIAIDSRPSELTEAIVLLANAVEIIRDDYADAETSAAAKVPVRRRNFK